jgi:hypothetical protein
VSVPPPPPCKYGQWREEHPATDPVEITRVQTHAGPDEPVYACRECIPAPFDPGAP